MKDFQRSRYREKMIEYKFLSELTESIWVMGELDLEILKPEVDERGYDLVIATKSKANYIQIKSKKGKSKTSSFSIQKSLFEKKNSFVILVSYEELGKGIQISYKICALAKIDTEKLKTAKHTKANSEGIKKERPNMLSLQISEFSKATIEEISSTLI